MKKTDIFSLTYEQFKIQLKKQFGKGEYHAKALYRAIFKKGSRSFSHLPELAKSGDFAERFAQSLNFPLMEVEQVSGEEVKKFVTSLEDGSLIESVIIPMDKKRTTLCISSQVGCRMGCSFCRTGDMGFTRNLSVSEIVGQIMTATFEFGADIRNIVFMGMGEPLDNLDNVIQALEVMTQQHGLDIPYSKITLSTSGVVEGIRELTRRGLTQIRLAVSLNGAEDILRKKIMPITNRYSLQDLKEALQQFPLDKRGVFFIEYVILKGINDSEDDVDRIYKFCKDLPVRVNLIPYNGENFRRPSFEEVENFKKMLTERKLFVRVRTSRGDEISAACGQLAAEE